MIYKQAEHFTVYHGSCLDVMQELPDCSIDSIVTDPPYELGFMGKSWDASGIAYNVEVWRQALRVLKPGGHLLAFSGSRTYHRMAVAIEDAGFEIRDQIMWIYGSGFPKSLDVSKAIDKRGGVVADFSTFRDAVKVAMKENNISRQQLQDALGNYMLSHYLTAGSQPAVPTYADYKIIRDTVNLGTAFDYLFADEAERQVVGSKFSGIANVQEGPRHTIGAGKAIEVDITAPATAEAQQWEGWGTALKPAHEPIVVARKPLIGTVAANVLAYGTGGLNIDGCRIGTEGGTAGAGARVYGNGLNGTFAKPVEGLGRWPANVLFDEEAAAVLDGQSGIVKGQIGMTKTAGGHRFIEGDTETVQKFAKGVTDTGGASRFFYVAKASKRDRNEGLEGFEIKQTTGGGGLTNVGDKFGSIKAPAQNFHPTVKPTQLMQYLVRLVTPPNGVVLDPFLGSGSTGKAAMREGFDFIGIELTDDYLPLAVARIESAERPLL